MNKEIINEKLIAQKNAKLIDVMEIAGKIYAKTLVVLEDGDSKFEYKYYEINKDNINELDNEKLKKIKSFFETNLGNVVY